MRMFRKLVGEDAFKSVILATTFWEKVSEDQGTKRENELRTKDDYWGRMVEQGSQMTRLQNTRESGLEILELVSKSKVLLQAQDDMRNGKSVQETAAAHAEDERAAELREELEKQKVEERMRLAYEIRWRKREQEQKMQRERELFNEKVRRAQMEAKAQRVKEAKERQERYEKERRALELENERKERERLQRRAELERQEREEEKSKKERERKIQLDFQTNYVCINHGPKWPCDKCKGPVKRTNVYFRKSRHHREREMHF